MMLAQREQDQDVGLTVEVVLMGQPQDYTRLRIIPRFEDRRWIVMSKKMGIGLHQKTRHAKQ